MENILHYYIIIIIGYFSKGTRDRKIETDGRKFSFLQS